MQLSMFGSGSTEVRDRIKRLRLLRRWDQAGLGTRAGLSGATISNLELGRAAITSEHITAIAEALEYRPQFLTAELDLLPTTRPWLRAYADASKREADARTAGTTVAVEYIRLLGLKPLPDQIPHFDGSAADEEAIEDAATEVRTLAQIDDGGVVPNAMRAAERLGCIVLPLESELGRHVGMSVRSDGMPVMSVAKEHVPGDRQRWTVAHELGHIVLHADVPPPRDAREARRLEDQAHRFAAAFLAPAEPLLETLHELGGRPTLNTLAEMKAVWGVAIKALVHRLLELGRIDQDHARSLYKQISARKWAKDEPVHVALESAQWLERAVTRKAGVSDAAAAAEHLADTIGGNAADLLGFVSWAPSTDAKIIDFPGGARR